MKKEELTFGEYLVLTPAENRVLQYLISQKHGVSISDISQNMNIARTSIYNTIDKLRKKNLVAKNGFLYTITNKKWKSYDQKESTPTVQIKKLMDEMLTLKKGEIIYSIESDEEIRELSNLKKELLYWQRGVVKKGIVLKGIGTKKSLGAFQEILNKELSEEIKKRSGSARFTDDTIKGPCVLVSFKNTVVFFSRSKNFFYRIDNPNVARFMQGVIDSLYSHYQYKNIV